jgi:hypothetical protein
MLIFYDSHTLSLHIVAISLTKTLKKRIKKMLTRLGFELQTSHTPNERVTPSALPLHHGEVLISKAE